MRRKARLKISVLVNAGIFEIVVAVEGSDVKAHLKSAKNRRRVGVFSGAILGPGIIRQSPSEQYHPIACSLSIGQRIAVRTIQLLSSGLRPLI